MRNLTLNLFAYLGRKLKVIVALPAAFLGRWIPSFSIFWDGDTYSTDFNFDALKPSGTVKWVSKSGSDTNPGTQALPYRTLAKAYTDGAVVVNIGAGVWDRVDGFAANFNPVRSMALVSVDGPGAAILTRHPPNLVWTQQASPNGAVYSTTRSAAKSILDLTAVGRAGEFCKDGTRAVPIPLTAVASVAACQALAGSYFISGSSVYVHTWDNRAPDSNVLVLITENIMAPTAAVNIWIDGIEGWGDSFARHSPTTNNTNFFAWRDSAARFCSSSANLLNVNNIAYCYSIRCSVSDHLATYDGFNYHSDGAGLITRTNALEVDCTSRRVGANDAGKNDNASTGHDNVNIIRINGVYGDNWGPSIADVLGAYSVNLGCTAYGNKLQTIGDTTGQNAGFQVGTVSTIDGVTSKMWVSNVTAGSGNRYSLAQVAGGELYNLGGLSDASTNGTYGTIS